MLASESNPIAISLRSGGVNDVDAVLRLFDESIAWLVANGRTGQWGSNPWSTDPHRQHRILTMVTDHDLTVVEAEGKVIAALVTSRVPPTYISAALEPEIYIHLLISSPSVRGSNIGSALLDHARDLAQTAGITLLRVDSWGGGDGKLVAYYVSQGFTPFSRFENSGWVGQLYEQHLDSSA